MNLFELEHQGASLIPAVAYGDAAGLPVETRDAAFIAERYRGIRSLIPTGENELFKGISVPGYWSDDTQLTVAVARALIYANGFDMDAQADAHLHAYYETAVIFRNNKMLRRGWGGSTVEAMQKLDTGISPEHAGTLDGAGNGVLMKLSPLAYWQIVRKTPLAERYEQYDQLTTMTHDSDIARLTTRVHGDILEHLLTYRYTKQGFLQALNSSVDYHEAHMEQKGVLKDTLAYLADPIDAQTILARTDAKGFYAPQTLAMAYGAFMMHDGKFEQSVYEAVNLGGDTDSTASIVAAMSTFSTKEKLHLPSDAVRIDRNDELAYISRRFAHAAFKGMKKL